MTTLIPGHRYTLDSFEGTAPQTLQFIQKEMRDGQLVTIADGTTNEEVLTVLIDRLGVLNAKFPCRENSIVMTHLETALLWLNKRTADRKARGVEGQHKP